MKVCMEMGLDVCIRFAVMALRISIRKNPKKIAKIELTKVPIRAKIIEHVLGPFFYGQKPDCEQAEVPAAVNIIF